MARDTRPEGGIGAAGSRGSKRLKTVRAAPGGPGLSRRRLLLGASAAAVLGGVVGGRGTRRVVAAPVGVTYPPARAVTRGPKHHFFGYYDKCPWDATGRYLLAMEIGFFDRQPRPGEPLTLGMVDLKDGNKYIPFDTTLAWCWQQGTMLQWLGSAPDREVMYNSVEQGRYLSVIRDVHSGKTRRLPRPVYSLSRDGTQAVSLDFDRVERLRPGYGYMAIAEKYKDAAAPAEAGLYWMDLKTGANKLVVSLEWAANNKPDERFAGGQHWFNHLEFNPSGTRFSFLHRWRSPKKGSWWTRFYTANPDGSEIRLLSDIGMVSHYDWRDDQTVLAWTRTKEKGSHFYLMDDRTGKHEVVGEGVLKRDGHCSYSPDRQWILNDTYPDAESKQTLMLYRPADGKRVDIGRFYQPPVIRGKPYRCDLHPRWNRDGTQVCIDSSHDPTRQVYVIDVSRITKA